MRRSVDFWLSLSAPLLVLLAIFVFVHRKDNDRVQSIPSLLTGIGLTCSNFIGRSLRRKNLLKDILQEKNEVIEI